MLLAGGGLGAAVHLAGCDSHEGEAADPELELTSQALVASATVKVVDTVAELRGVAGAFGWVAVLGGYGARGDGGGGTFYWDTAIGVDNSGTIVNPLVSGTINPNPAAGWRRLYEGSISVKWFGASGNGVANDRDAIAAALAVAISSGRPLYFPRGLYGVGSTASAPYANLRITSSNVRVVGDGSGVSTIKLLQTWPSGQLDVPAIFSIIHPSVLSGAQSSSNEAYCLSGITFEGLGFVGLGLADSVTVKAITCRGSRDIIVTRCRFTDFGGEMIWQNGTGPTAENRRWSITDNVFENSVRANRGGSSLQMNCDDSTVIGNRLIRCTHAIGVTGNGNVVHGNSIENSWGLSIGIGETAPSDTGQRNTVTGNVIYLENDAGYGPVGIRLDVADGAIIANNTIRIKNVVSSTHTPRGIMNVAAGRGNLIQGNTIELDMAGLAAGVEGIRLEHPYGSPECTVANNKVRVRNENTTRNRTGIGAFTMADGVQLTVMLSGNTIDGMTAINTGGDGNAVYVQEFGGPAARLRCSAQGNVSTGGAQRYISPSAGISLTYPTPDNTMIYCSTVGPVVVV